MGAYVISKIFLLKTMLFIKFIIFWNSKIYHLFSTFPKRHHATNSGTKTMIGTANPTNKKPPNPAKMKKKASPKEKINTLKKNKGMLTTNIQNDHKNSELPLSSASSSCIL